MVYFPLATNFGTYCFGKYNVLRLDLKVCCFGKKYFLRLDFKVYSFGKMNVLRLDLKEVRSIVLEKMNVLRLDMKQSRQGFCPRGGGRSITPCRGAEDKTLFVETITE